MTLQWWALSAASAAVLIAAPARPVRAGDTKIVVFPVVPLAGEVEGDAAREMTDALVEELGLQAGNVVIEGASPSDASAKADTGRRPARSDAEYRAALALLEEGTTSANRLRFPQAIKSLARGIEQLTRNLDLLDDYQRLLDAHLLLSVAHFRRGKESAGTDVLEQLTRLRPDIQIDASEYPPMFMTILEDTRQRVLGYDRAKVHITSTPSGAEVFFNGRSLGRTPLLVEEVAPGENHVVVRTGDGAWMQVIEARSNRTIEVMADLGAGDSDTSVSLGDGVAANRFDREVRKTARAFAQDAGGDWVVVTAMGKGNGVYALAGYLGNAKTGKWAALEPVAPDYDMLSASIEAHTLARDIAAKMASFSPDAGDDTRPFIRGKPIGAGGIAGAGGAGNATTVAFIGARPGSGRGPAAPGSAAARGPVAPGSAAARGPIAGRGPVTARSGPRVEPGVEPVATDGDPALVPPPGGGGRGPVLKAGDTAAEIDLDALSDVESDVEAEPETAAEEPLPDVMPDAAIAAVPAGTGPLAPDLELEAAAANDDSVLKTWWFWTAVVGGAAVIAGGTTAAVVLSQQPSSDHAQVFAVWK